LKKYNINIAFRTSNTLGRYLKKAIYKSENSELLDKCGVCKLKCGSCSGVYQGQTGRNFKTRFKEHVTLYITEINLDIHITYWP
jgi:hypothetical protein